MGATIRSNMGATIQESASTPAKHPLDDARARVSRAEQHLVELMRRVSERGQQHLEAIGTRAHPSNPNQVVVDPRTDLPLDLMFSVLVGEICYNLRATLDYLVYELAKYNSKAPQKQTQFPIVNDPADFPQAGTGRLLGVNQKHTAMIEDLQPYKGCSWTAALRDMSHKTLSLVQAEHELTVHVVDENHLSGLENLPGRTVQTGAGNQVFVKFDLKTALQFGDGAQVMEALAVC
jgi:hypothetical protein